MVGGKGQEKIERAGLPLSSAPDPIGSGGFLLLCAAASWLVVEAYPSMGEIDATVRASL